MFNEHIFNLLFVLQRINEEYRSEFGRSLLRKEGVSAAGSENSGVD